MEEKAAQTRKQGKTEKNEMDGRGDHHRGRNKATDRRNHK